MTLLLGTLATDAAHAGERELQITLEPGYSSIPGLADGLDGLGGGAEVSYGLSAFWSLAAGGFFGHQFEQTVDDTTYAATNVGSVWIGPRFNLDVFVVVPFVSLGPEVLLTRGELLEEQDELEWAWRGSIGFDYRPRRAWSAGFEVGYHAFLRAPLDYPVFITALFRLSFHHDFAAL